MLAEQALLHLPRPKLDALAAVEHLTEDSPLTLQDPTSAHCSLSVSARAVCPLAALMQPPRDPAQGKHAGMPGLEEEHEEQVEFELLPWPQGWLWLRILVLWDTFCLMNLRLLWQTQHRLCLRGFRSTWSCWLAWPQTSLLEP